VARPRPPRQVGTEVFRRYLTSEVLLRQDEVEGSPGEIHDSEVIEESSDSKEQSSERSTSDPAAKSPAKEPASTATPSRPRPAAKKAAASGVSASSPSCEEEGAIQRVIAQPASPSCEEVVNWFGIIRPGK
jgi:hypothetical protein